MRAVHEFLRRESLKKQKAAEAIRDSNISRMIIRLNEIANRPNARQLLHINFPDSSTDFSQWSERLYTPKEIDLIIIQSGLVVKKTQTTSIGFLTAAAKVLPPNDKIQIETRDWDKSC